MSSSSLGRLYFFLGVSDESFERGCVSYCSLTKKEIDRQLDVEGEQTTIIEEKKRAKREGQWYNLSLFMFPESNSSEV